MHAIKVSAASPHGRAITLRVPITGRGVCVVGLFAALLASMGCGQARFEERLKQAVGMAATEMAKQGLSPQEKAEMDQRIKAQNEARERMLKQLRERRAAPPAAGAPAADAAAPAAPAANTDKKPEADYPTPAARAVLAPPDAFE